MALWYLLDVLAFRNPITSTLLVQVQHKHHVLHSKSMGFRNEGEEGARTCGEVQSE